MANDKRVQGPGCWSCRHPHLLVAAVTINLDRQGCAGAHIRRLVRVLKAPEAAPPLHVAIEAKYNQHAGVTLLAG